MPVPRLFDIRPPAGACTSEWMTTSRERDVAHQLEPGEDHPVLPEADDVARRRVEVARVERAQVLGVVGPAERRERPERGREPRVEHVRRPRQLARAALGARVRLRLLDGDVPVRALPQRQLMPPPDLPRDVPVGRVLERLDREAVLRLGVERARGRCAAPRAPASSARPSSTTTAARSAARCASCSGRRARPCAGTTRASRAGRAP